MYRLGLKVAVALVAIERVGKQVRRVMGDWSCAKKAPVAHRGFEDGIGADYFLASAIAACAAAKRATGTR